MTQGTYSFPATVLRREFSNVQLYALSMPQSFERVQMRNFARVQCLISVEYCWENDDRWQSGSAIDISGAGMKLSHGVFMDNDTVIALHFALRPGGKQFSLRGRVVRCLRAGVSGAGLYHSGIEFLEIPMTAQDEIVGFVFERMLEIRRLGEG